MVESYRPLPIRPPKVAVDRRADGSVIIEQDYEMPARARSLPHVMAERAAAWPERDFVAKREPLPGGEWGDWRRITFGEAQVRVRAIAQALINRGLGPDRSVMALSGGSIEHALLMLAAMTVRAPFTPVSAGYSLVSTDFAKLRHAVEVCRPKLIFVDDGPAYARALASLSLEGVEIVTLVPIPGLGATAFEDLARTLPTSAVDASLDAIRPETHAKTIFTSGSTGAPKGVIQTHGMLSGVIAQHDALYVRDDAEAPTYLSWLPWSHVSASNILFGDVINEGACLYIDDGKPVPGQFDETLRNLREISPREYSSTPIFYARLAAAMEEDDGLRDHFFRRLRYLSYATAGLSQDLFDRLQALSVAATGQRIPMITKYGSTETNGVTIVSTPIEHIGPIGLPFPGITIKLAPVGDKLEIRARGETVTPGYFGDPEASARAFDEEGFYRTGDAADFLDPIDPSKGLVFGGRVTENFKLASGTWVSVGPLRLSLIEALSPVVQDCVITGHDREEVAALAWLRPEAAAFAGLPSGAPVAGVAASEAVRAHVSGALKRYNSGCGGASRRVTRLLLLDEPPIGDEMAEKGYINQRAVLTRRSQAVERLYRPVPDAAVICP